MRGEDAPDLGVAHEPIAKPDGRPVRGQQALTAVLLANRVHVRRRARLDGIPLEPRLYCDTPAIVDDQADLFLRRHRRKFKDKFRDHVRTWALFRDRDDLDLDQD